MSKLQLGRLTRKLRLRKCTYSDGGRERRCIASRQLNWMEKLAPVVVVVVSGRYFCCCCCSYWWCYCQQSRLGKQAVSDARYTLPGHRRSRDKHCAYSFMLAQRLLMSRLQQQQQPPKQQLTGRGSHSLSLSLFGQTRLDLTRFYSTLFVSSCRHRCNLRVKWSRSKTRVQSESKSNFSCLHRATASLPEVELSARARPIN